MSEEDNDLLSRAATDVDIPGGAIPVHGITILSYIDEEGESTLGWVAFGDPRIDETLSAMVMAQHLLIEETLRPTDDD